MLQVVNLLHKRLNLLGLDGLATIFELGDQVLSEVSLVGDKWYVALFCYRGTYFLGSLDGLL